LAEKLFMDTQEQEQDS